MLVLRVLLLVIWAPAGSPAVSRADEPSKSPSDSIADCPALAGECQSDAWVRRRCPTTCKEAATGGMVRGDVNSASSGLPPARSGHCAQILDVDHTHPCANMIAHYTTMESILDEDARAEVLAQVERYTEIIRSPQCTTAWTAYQCIMNHPLCLEQGIGDSCRNRCDVDPRLVKGGLATTIADSAGEFNEKNGTLRLLPCKSHCQQVRLCGYPMEHDCSSLFSGTALDAWRPAEPVESSHSCLRPTGIKGELVNHELHTVLRFPYSRWRLNELKLDVGSSLRPQLFLHLRGGGRASFGSWNNAFGVGDRALIDFALAEHPRLADVLEIGTGSGLTSLHFGMMSRLRGGTMHSFDVKDHRSTSIKAAWLPNMHFHETDAFPVAAVRGLSNQTCTAHNTKGEKDGLDPQLQSGCACPSGAEPNGHIWESPLWSEELTRKFAVLCRSTEVTEALRSLRPNRTFAFFDADKLNEVALYASLLHPGDMFAIHDWDDMVSFREVLPITHRIGFEPVYTELAETLMSSVRLFAASGYAEMGRFLDPGGGVSPQFSANCISIADRAEWAKIFNDQSWPAEWEPIDMQGFSKSCQKCLQQPYFVNKQAEWGTRFLACAQKLAPYESGRNDGL